MESAAFVAGMGAVDDEGGHLDEVAQFEDFAGDAEIPSKIPAPRAGDVRRRVAARCRRLVVRTMET